jgi:hypothetical protein
MAFALFDDDIVRCERVALRTAPDVRTNGLGFRPRLRLFPSRNRLEAGRVYPAVTTMAHDNLVLGIAAKPSYAQTLW